MRATELLAVLRFAVSLYDLRSFSKSSRHLTPWQDHRAHGQNSSTQVGTDAGNSESLLRVLPGVDVRVSEEGERAVCQVSSSLSPSATS